MNISIDNDVKRALSKIVERAPDLGERPDDRAMSYPAPGRQRGPLLAVAAAAIVVGGLGIGVVALNTPTAGDRVSSGPAASSLDDAQPVIDPSEPDPPLAVSSDPSTISEPPPSDPAETTPGQRVPSFDDLVTQLVETRAVTYSAVASATSECMATQGFAFDGATLIVEPTILLEQRIWSFPNATQAAASGYAIPGTADSTGPATPEATAGAGYEAALTGDVIGEWTADPAAPIYSGSPVGGEIFDGCLPTARIDIIGGGDPAKSFRLNDFDYQLQDIGRRASDIVIADPRWDMAQADWARCMSVAGYDFTTIIEPFESSWSEPRGDQDEVDTATTDWRCKTASGVPELGQNLFDDALAVDADTLIAISEEMDQIADRAQTR